MLVEQYSSLMFLYTIKTLPKISYSFTFAMSENIWRLSTYLQLINIIVNVNCSRALVQWKIILLSFFGMQFLCHSFKKMQQKFSFFPVKTGFAHHFQQPIFSLINEFGRKNTNGAYWLIAFCVKSGKSKNPKFVSRAACGRNSSTSHLVCIWQP